MPTTPTPRKQLVIGGASEFAEIAYEYFTHDSPYEVVGFVVDAAYKRKDDIFGLPLVTWGEVADRFPPAEHAFFAAATYTWLNRLRTQWAARAKDMGYALATYVSSRSFVWRNVEVGEHCFIFEDNTVQPFVKIGDNCVLWSGNHIGHHTKIRDNVFIASQVVISGLCDVGESCFIGVNATFANNLTIAPDALIGAGVSVLKDTVKGAIYGARNTKPFEGKTAYDYFKVPEDLR